MDCLGLYVDVENLLDVAKEAITDTLTRWPEELPRPSLLNLYVKADNTGVWRLWATDAFPSMTVTVTGVQHYAMDGSKNSADIALALDAIADLLRSKISHVAILSDDSDFAILFGKIEQDIPKLGNGRLPFIWFQTDRPRTRSLMLSEFLPAHYVRTVICAKQKTVVTKTKPSAKQKTAATEMNPPVQQKTAKAEPKPLAKQKTLTSKAKSPTKPKTVIDNTKPATKPKTATSKTKLPTQTAGEQGLNVSLAETIIRLVQVGSFEHKQCMKLIKEHFPEHSFAKLNSTNFGTHFVKTLWPILEGYGVIVPNPNRRPKRYEMTAEAKQKVGVS
jgi:hypothetical protein